ncbi:uncharacterized protein [Eucyclogobius newberryi]|uniref:uncharacterized protein n=1 Tax=Eucyclogobius newberryi TaxID=166745 RepID=UPI003B5BD82D
MKDLTEQDDGAIVFIETKGVQLKIKDCEAPDTKYYGDVFSWRIPSSAKYLEFAQVVPGDSPLKPLVIWNRTDPSSSRGKIQHGYFEKYQLKQKDSGYYKLRGSQNELLRWKRLKVEENHRDFDEMEGNHLDLDFPVKFQLEKIEFESKESGIVRIIEESSMRHRMEVTESYFTLRDLKWEDSGTYRLKDEDGFVAFRVELKVMEGVAPIWPYFFILAIIILGILICACCVKKCCCKKSSSPGSSARAAPPPVYHHGSNQPAQTTVTLLSTKPRHWTADATMCNRPTTIINPPPSTQATVRGGSGLTSPLANVSDCEPTFELKGSIFSSAPPLSSDTSIQHVYTSDKLNFL